MIKKIVIVGGGTAGWLAASHIAMRLKPHLNKSYSVVLIDSPDIPTVGVGEGTVPVIKDTLKYFGISESEFIKQCDVSFKQSIKFVDWEYTPGTTEKNYYHHGFDFPKLKPFDITPNWLLDEELNKLHYADLVSVQSHACNLNLSPKRLVDKEYSGIFNYAYHLDAGKFTHLLSKHAIEKLGVENIKATVIDVSTTNDGYINGVTTEEAGFIDGDFFVDCTGFKGLLINETLKGEFINKGDILLADTALAIQVPYEDEEQEIPPFTISTAQKNGWIWDIGLRTRRGVGYVFSNKHETLDEALNVLSQYLNQEVTEKDVRKIDMKVGYQKQPWINNCVAMGLSQGFVEPLEATGLLMFDVTARIFADLIPPDKTLLNCTAELFNRDITQMWESTCDFIQLHYCLSKRTDSQFWIENTDESRLSPTLKEKLSLWQRKLPSQFDFRYSVDSFRLDNFLYVLYGMNFKTNLEHYAHMFENKEQDIQNLKNSISEGVRFCEQNLTGHRAFLEQVNKFGLTKV